MSGPMSAGKSMSPAKLRADVRRFARGADDAFAVAAGRVFVAATLSAPPRDGGLRGLLDDAETERNCYRAKLIALMGAAAFETWRAKSAGLAE